MSPLYSWISGAFGFQAFMFLEQGRWIPAAACAIVSAILIELTLRARKQEFIAPR